MQSRPVTPLSELFNATFNAIVTDHVTDAGDHLSNIMGALSARSCQESSKEGALEQDLASMHFLLLAAARKLKFENIAINIFDCLLRHYLAAENPSGISTRSFTMDMIDESGSTALIHAVRAGSCNLVRKMLEDNVCDPTIKNHAGEDALRAAWNTKQTHLVTIIEPVWQAHTKRREAKHAEITAVLKTSYGDKKELTFFSQSGNTAESVTKKAKTKSSRQQKSASHH